MDFKQAFSINEDKEENGVWFKWQGDMEFLVARWGNKACAALTKRVMKPYQRLLDSGRMDVDLARELEAEIASRTVLLDWRGVKDGDRDVPYSVEEAKKRLIETPLFMGLIRGLAMDVANYQDQEQAAAAKN